MSETEQIICQLKELADFSADCVSGDMPDCESALRLAAAEIERLNQSTEAPSELEAVRASAQEWASIAEHWMNRHDKLLDFIRADPDRLKALHAWQSWEVSGT